MAARLALPRRIALGVASLDDALGGGLPLGAVHEIRGAAALAFAARACRRIRGTHLWISTSCHPIAPYAGERGGGNGGAGRQLVIQAGSITQALWAAEVGLASPVCHVVVLVLAERVGEVASRQLRHAARAGGAAILVVAADWHLLRQTARAETSSPSPSPALTLAGRRSMVSNADTRWRAGYLASGCEAGAAGTHLAAVAGEVEAGLNRTILELELTRNRFGIEGMWRVDGAGEGG